MPNTTYGQKLLSWSVLEMPHHDRSKAWYVVVGLIALGLILYALFIGDGQRSNPLFALIILLVVVIFFAQSIVGNRQINLTLYENGLEVGRQFFAYREMSNFYIIYQPPQIKQLYIVFKSLSQPRLCLDLSDVNPVKIRQILVDYLDEDLDKEQESLTETIGRGLKL